MRKLYLTGRIPLGYISNDLTADIHCAPVQFRNINGNGTGGIDPQGIKLAVGISDISGSNTLAVAHTVKTGDIYRDRDIRGIQMRHQTTATLDR